ncbi:MAG TPA: hypothetical protein VGK59_10475 [Ohtaekwangia sp.]
MKLSSLCIITALALSCQEEEQGLTRGDTQDITEEALTDSYFQDMDDLGSVAIDAPSDETFEGGRKQTSITINDDRFDCEGVVITINATGTPETPQGTITVDFGTTGCTDLRGNVRTGKLIFTYSGRRFQPGSTLVTTTDNYTINGVKLEGTRTSTNVQSSTTESPKFNVVLENGKATFEDGSIATRESNITWSWIRGANPIQDELIIDDSSEAEGTTRSGKDYVVTILEDLVYQRTCFIAVGGIKKYVINDQKEIVIDYGTGDCKTISVTVNGITRNVILK